MRSVAVDTPDRSAAFASIPLLEAVPPVVREALLARTRPHTTSCGSILFRQGQPVTELVLLLTGRVAGQVDSARGRVVTVATWFGPAALDKMAALAGGTHSCTAYAATNCQWCAMSLADLEDLIDDVPALRRHVLHVLARQADAAQRAFVDAATLPTSARLARWLLDQAADSAELCVRDTQEDIARVLGVTRVTLNRALHRLVRDQLIEIGTRHITLLAPEALVAHAAGVDHA